MTWKTETPIAERDEREPGFMALVDKKLLRAILVRDGIVEATACEEAQATPSSAQVKQQRS